MLIGNRVKTTFTSFTVWRIVVSESSSGWASASVAEGVSVEVEAAPAFWRLILVRRHRPQVARLAGWQRAWSGRLELEPVEPSQAVAERAVVAQPEAQLSATGSVAGMRTVPKRRSALPRILRLSTQHKQTKAAQEIKCRVGKWRGGTS